MMDSEEKKIRTIASDEAVKTVNGHVVIESVCVCCGAPVPEGWQICWECEHQFDFIQ